MVWIFDYQTFLKFEINKMRFFIEIYKKMSLKKISLKKINFKKVKKKIKKYKIIFLKNYYFLKYL